MNQNIVTQHPAAAQPAASLDELLQRHNLTAQISIAFTVIEAAAGCAAPSKSYGVAEDGRPVVVSSGSQPAAGLATRVSWTGSAGSILFDVASVLDDLSPRQAIVCAPPPPGAAAWPFVSRKDLHDRTDVIARTQQYFPAPAGPALFGLDFDIKAWPRDLQKRMQQTPGQLAAILRDVAPCFGDGAYVRRASSSVGIRNPLTGAQTDGNSGRHFFYIAKRGDDVARAVRILHQRLILAGWGYGFVSEAGTVLVRSIVDVDAASDLSRLWFEGRVQLADGLELIPDARSSVVFNRDGGAIDTALVAELDAAELARLAAREDALREACSGEAELKRSAWQEKRQAELVARGVRPERAAKAVKAAVERHTLTSDFRIELDEGGTVTVAEIEADPAGFHRKTCADPIEPEYGGGRNKAVIYADCAPARIESQAHGGIQYILETTRFFEAQAPTEETGPLDIFGDADPAQLGTVPSGALPPLLMRWVRTEARRKGVPEAFAALSALTAVGAAVGSDLRIQVRQKDTTWTEGPIFWGVLVADPGSAKSPIIAAATEAIRRLDAEWAKADGFRHAEWSEAKAAKRKKPSESPILGPEPRIRRAVIDDATPEKIIRILADNPRGLLRIPDELVGMLASFGAYKTNGDGDRSQFLRLFDGGSVTSDRVGSGNIRADRAAVSVIAGTQPDKLRGMVKNLGDDGMLQRFIFVLHDGVERRALDEEPDLLAIGSYERLIRNLQTTDYGFASTIKISSAAGKVLETATAQIAKLKHLPGAGPALKGHLEKWGKILPRVVLVFHAIEQHEANGRIDLVAEVTADTVGMAIRFSRFLLRHSVRFYETYFGAPDAINEARWVAGYFLTHPKLATVRRRDIYDARKTLRGADGKHRALLAVMAELEGSGWCSVSERDAEGPTAWAVAPEIHTRFAERGDRELRERARRQVQIKEAGLSRHWVDGETERDADEVNDTPSAFD